MAVALLLVALAGDVALQYATTMNNKKWWVALGATTTLTIVLTLLESGSGNSTSPLGSDQRTAGSLIARVSFVPPLILVLVMALVAGPILVPAAEGLLSQLGIASPGEKTRHALRPPAKASSRDGLQVSVGRVSDVGDRTVLTVSLRNKTATSFNFFDTFFLGLVASDTKGRAYKIWGTNSWPGDLPPHTTINARVFLSEVPTTVPSIELALTSGHPLSVKIPLR